MTLISCKALSEREGRVLLESASMVAFLAPSCFSFDVSKGDTWAKLSDLVLLSGYRSKGAKPHPAAKHEASEFSRCSIWGTPSLPAGSLRGGHIPIHE